MESPDLESPDFFSVFVSTEDALDFSLALSEDLSEDGSPDDSSDREEALVFGFERLSVA